MNTNQPSFRKRSPRFPSHSLREAINYAQKIYEAVHRSPVDAETAYRIMGFAGKSGSSATALGSVRQYGLIEGFAEKTRISDLALQILEPESTAEFDKAIKNAAYEPSIFQTISERFAGKIPTVDEPIRAFLIRDMHFSRNGADDCIQSLRDTISFLPAESTPQPQPANSTQPSSQDSEILPSSISSSATFPDESQSREVTQIKFPLTKDCSAEITLRGNITSEAVSRLQKQIGLLSDIWTSSD